MIKVNNKMLKRFIDMEHLKMIEFNYNNLEILKIIKHLLGVVINDIENMNSDLELFNDKDFDLGNDNKIKAEQVECLTSILDTIDNIINYNKESE